MRRIKTLAEFGGERPQTWNFLGRMDYLYGKLLNEDFDEVVSINNWMVRYEETIEVTPFTEKPDGAKVKDKFIICAERSLQNGITSKEYLTSKRLKIGDIVTLSLNDNSNNPFFIKDGSTTTLEVSYVIDWGCLAPYYGSVNDEISSSKDKAVKEASPVTSKYKIGDEVKIFSLSDTIASCTFHIVGISKTHYLLYSKELSNLKMGHDGNTHFTTGNGDKTGHWVVKEENIESLISSSKKQSESKSLEDEYFTNKLQPQEVIGTEYIVGKGRSNNYYEVGDRIRYIHDDGTASPKFLNLRTGKHVYISWGNIKRNHLNLNTQQDGKESHTVELVLSRISATVSYGTTPRGIAVSSSRSKIQLGGQHL
jgi:hypothetical protein